MEKIKYNFYLWKINKQPCLKIHSPIEYFSTEIGMLTSKQIKMIVNELQELKNDWRDECHFWYECIVVWCRRKIEWGKYTPWKIYCQIDYDYGDESIEVPFDDIYNLMKDWKDYIEKWEQETGLKFP